MEENQILNSRTKPEPIINTTDHTKSTNRTNVRSEKKYSKRSSNKLLYLLYFFSERTLNAIRFVNSICTIFSLWKKDPPHQTFPS